MPPAPKSASSPVWLSMESVAREAGVSASTVSRALRSDPRISPLTRKKIEEVVARMGYRPNPLVSALMTQLRDGHPPEAKCNLGWLDFFKDPEEWNRDPVHRAFYTGAQQRATALGYALSRIPSTDRPDLRPTDPCPAQPRYKRAAGAKFRKRAQPGQLHSPPT